MVVAEGGRIDTGQAKYSMGMGVVLGLHEDQRKRVPSGGNSTIRTQQEERTTHLQDRQGFGSALV